MKNVLMIGYKGEVGSAIYSILKESKKYKMFKKDTEPLNLNEKVDVMGISKGKGFQGVVKRWHFKGGPHTHGQSDRERHPGSIGQRMTPGRVFKGKKMGGRMGGEIKTVKNLRVKIASILK